MKPSAPDRAVAIPGFNVSPKRGSKLLISTVASESNEMMNLLRSLIEQPVNDAHIVNSRSARANSRFVDYSNTVTSTLLGVTNYVFASESLAKWDGAAIPFRVSRSKPLITNQGISDGGSGISAK